MIRTLLFIVLLGVASASFSSKHVFDAQLTQLALDHALEFIEDTEHQYAIDDILHNDLTWQQNTEKTFNKSYSESTWWLRLHLKNTGEIPLERLLELSYAVLDYVDIYITDNGNVLQSYSLGDKQSYHDRIIDHRFFIIPIQWQAKQTLDIYFKIDSTSAIQAPLTLWDEKTFFGHDSTRTMLQGIFFGTMIVIAIYNLLIYFALGERAYILYVGYVLCMPLFLASMGGYSFQYLWPTSTQWNDHAIIVFLAGVVIFGVAFTRRFLIVYKYTPLLDKFLIMFLIGGLVFLVSAFILPYRVNVVSLITWASGACILCLVVGIKCWSLGQETARYYTLAWVSMLSGGLVLALNKAGLVPINLFTEYSTHIGSSMEVVLLSFALAERINTERRLRFEAQTNSLAITQRANEELEDRVLHRTHELEALAQQLRELSITDELTGLHNRRYLEDILKEEWARGLRYQRPLAVILLDIDHFKSVNDTYGHLVGDECLIEISKCLASSRRWPSDLIVRFGGEEFCVVLPETDLAGAIVVAERILNLTRSTTIKTGQGPLTVTMSAGAYAATPTIESSTESFLEQADKALYIAKNEGRDRVCFSPIKKS